MTHPRRRSRRFGPIVGALLGMAVVIAAVAIVVAVGTLADPPASSRGAAAPSLTAGSTASMTSAPSSSGSAPSSSLAPMPLASPISSSGSADASPTAAPTPSPSPSLDPPPAAGPFAMNLYHRGGFVSELTPVQCVPAAMQTMINIMAGTTDTTNATQERLYALARKLSPKTLKGSGAEPEGWAAGLGKLGYGTFVVKVQPTMKAAIQAAAKAIRMTGRPAGLLVWYGAHSWVMSGFKATADPAYTDHFTVTAVYIEDVWYPKISTIWGSSRPPNALVPVSKLPRDYLPWRMPGGPYPDKIWKYVQVLPVASTL